VSNFLTQLNKKYRLEARSFGTRKGTTEHARRVVIANMAVAASLDENAVQAAIGIGELANPTEKRILKVLEANSLRFAPTKAKNIAVMLEYLNNNPVPSTLKGLTKFKGIGEHNAKIILNRVYGQNHFAVDLHVRRIAVRMGIVPPKASDETITNLVMGEVKPEQWANLSRAFVDFGKEYCAKNPACNSCPFSKDCPKINETAKSGKKTFTVSKSTVAGKVAPGRYNVIAGSSDTPYTVTVKNTISCSCKGYRFRRTCGHVKFVAGEGEGSYA